MSPNQIPYQSPGAGVASADVKTTGFVAVPLTTSAPCAGVSPEKRCTVTVAYFFIRIFTPASIVNVASPGELGACRSIVRLALSPELLLPTRYGTPRLYIVV